MNTELKTNSAHAYSKSPGKQRFERTWIMLGYKRKNSEIHLLFWRKLTVLKTTIGHRKKSDQNQKFSDETENTLDILSDGKNSRQNYGDYASVEPLIEDVGANFSSFSEIFSNKFQYARWRFSQKHLYRRTLQKYNSKSLVFTSSSANKEKTLNAK